MFFLVLSSAYWLMSVLNDTMEREVAIPVQLTGVPKNVIILSDNKATAHVVLRDKGYTIATYLYGDKIKPVNISFSTYARGINTCYVAASELQKLIAAQLYGSTKVVSVKPDKIEFLFNYGMFKRVPVRLSGKVRTGENYYLSRLTFIPESVTVYSSRTKLDSIRAIYTTRQNLQNVTDTLKRIVALRSIPETKIVPNSVVMHVFPDIMTEAVALVPVTTQNVPEGSTMRTFPASVQVRYAIGASQYNAVDMSSFSVVADYNTTENGTSAKCNLRLVKAPRTARHPVIMTPQVDYLLEQ